MGIRALIEELEAGANAEVLARELDRRMDEFVRAGVDGIQRRAPELAAYLADTLSFRTSRTPKGMREAKEALQRIYDGLMDLRGASYVSPAWAESVGRLWARMPPRLELVRAFATPRDVAGGAVTELKLPLAAYANRAGMAPKRFRAFAEAVEETLGDLRGWRRRALEGGLRVAFVGAQELRSQGKYVRARDEMLVRMTPKVLQRSGGYGTFQYILVHELGHRYEARAGAPPAGAVGYTTRYSYTEGMGGDEAFAELFALGHFGIRGGGGKDWGDVLDRFEAAMAGA